MFDESRYLNLLSLIIPKPIESDEELDRFLMICESLAFKKDKSPEEVAIYNLLVLLIVDYENEHYPMDDPEPLDYLVFLMENKGVVQEDLVSILGNENLTKLILNGACEIDKPIAKVLGEYFNTSYKDFL